jgi:hypothetical protein
MTMEQNDTTKEKRKGKERKKGIGPKVNVKTEE